MVEDESLAAFQENTEFQKNRVIVCGNIVHIGHWFRDFTPVHLKLRVINLVQEHRSLF